MRERGLVRADCARGVITLAFYNNVLEERCGSLEWQAVGKKGVVRPAMDGYQRKSCGDGLSDESVRIG